MDFVVGNLHNQSVLSSLTPARPTWFSMRSLVSWSVLVWLVLAGSVLLFSLSRSLISRGPSRRDWHRRVTPFSSEDPETEMFVVGVREVRGVLGPTWAVVYTGCSPRVEFPVLAQLVSHVGSTASTSIPSSSSSSSPGSSQLQSFLSPFTNIPGKNKHLQLSEMQIQLFYSRGFIRMLKLINFNISSWKSYVHRLLGAPLHPGLC